MGSVNEKRQKHTKCGPLLGVTSAHPGDVQDVHVQKIDDSIKNPLPPPPPQKETNNNNNIIIYICICMLLCSTMGCFFPFHSFGNAPGHVFKNGVPRVRCQTTPIFTVLASSVHQLSQQVRPKDPASSWGTMLKMRLSKTDLLSFIFGTAFWLRVGVKVAFYKGVQKCQNCGDNGVVTFPKILKWPHEAQNRGLEKMGKIYFFDRTHPHFCVFGWHAWILQDTGFGKSTKFP